MVSQQEVGSRLSDPDHVCSVDSRFIIAAISEICSRACAQVYCSTYGEQGVATDITYAAGEIALPAKLDFQLNRIYRVLSKRGHVLTDEEAGIAKGDKPAKAHPFWAFTALGAAALEEKFRDIMPATLPVFRFQAQRVYNEEPTVVRVALLHEESSPDGWTARRNEYVRPDVELAMTDPAEALASRIPFLSSETSPAEAPNNWPLTRSYHEILDIYDREAHGRCFDITFGANGTPIPKFAADQPIDIRP